MANFAAAAVTKKKSFKTVTWGRIHYSLFLRNYKKSVLVQNKIELIAEDYSVQHGNFTTIYN
jgi:hypothetical protein